MKPLNVSHQGLNSDVKSLDALRGAAAKDPKAAIKEAAKQFEAVFMQELMKSMREATMKSGMFDNEGSDMASDMLDTQYATQMSGLPGGLAVWFEAMGLGAHVTVSDETEYATGFVVVETRG